MAHGWITKRRSKTAPPFLSIGRARLAAFLRRFLGLLGWFFLCGTLGFLGRRLGGLFRSRFVAGDGLLRLFGLRLRRRRRLSRSSLCRRSFRGGRGRGRCRFGRARSTNGHQPDFVLLFFHNLRQCSGLFVVLVGVVGAVPHVIGIILMSHPAAVFLVIAVIARRAAAAGIPNVVRVIVAIGEPNLPVQFVTPRHSPS